MIPSTTHRPLLSLLVLPARGQKDVRACVGNALNHQGGDHGAFYSLEIQAEAKT